MISLNINLFPLFIYSLTLNKNLVVFIRFYDIQICKRENAQSQMKTLRLKDTKCVKFM